MTTAYPPSSETLGIHIPLCSSKNLLNMDELKTLVRNLEVDRLKSILKEEVNLKGTLLSVCCSQSTDHKTQKGIIKLLLKNGVNINEIDKNGVTPIHRAVRFRNPKIVQFLIKNGADVNSIDKRSKSTPLHRAVVSSGAPSTKGKTKEVIEIIKILIASGADPKIKNKLGKTPLDYVRNEAIKKLLRNQ